MMDPSEAAGHTNYRKLAQRMGRKLLERRIRKQASLWAREVHQGKGFFMFEGIIPMDALVWHSIELAGLDKVARRNFLDVQIVHNEAVLPQLPAPFDGFRLMQLADLHCDLDPKLIDIIIERIDGLDYEVAVLTGAITTKSLASTTLPSLYEWDGLCRTLRSRVTQFWVIMILSRKWLFLKPLVLPSIERVRRHRARGRSSVDLRRR